MHVFHYNNPTLIHDAIRSELRIAGRVCTGPAKNRAGLARWAHLSSWTSYGGDLRLAPTARRPPVVHVLVEGGPLRPLFDVSRK